MKKQGYILRYYLPIKPYFDEEYTEKRFCELLDYCKRTQTEAVMLYVALDPNWYYISDTPDMAREGRDQMLPYIKRLRDAGIGYQLNFQNLVGSTLGGVDFSKNFSWNNLVDHRGRESLGCGCPIDENFRKETGERLRIWAETEPDIIWIDDDLRYHNHGTPILAKLEGESGYRDYYCFCDTHLSRFNEKYGTSFDRKSLIFEMTRIGEPSDLRRKYLDFLNETICETAVWIRETVHSVSPKTRLAQMTSNPDVHSAEGREWSEFLNALCGEYTPIIRATFGPYTEKDPRDFIDCYRKHAQMTAHVRERYSGKLEVCPEIENTRFTAWAKSAAATGFQLDLSAFMGNCDITLSLYDLDGGAFYDEERYKKLLIERKPYLDKLVDLSLGECEEDGIIIPTSQYSGKLYRLKRGDNYESLGGKDRYVEKYFLRMGIPCRYMTPEKVDGGVVALDGYSAGFLSDGEIKRILSGRVFIEADAAHTLLERGYGELIGIGGMEKQRVFVNAEKMLTFHRADGTYIRVPSRIPCDCWYNVEYIDGAERISEFLTPDGKVYPGLCVFENRLGGKVAIYPASKDFGDGFFTHHRVTLFKNVFESLSPALPRIDVEGYTLCVVKKGKDGGKYYFVANLSADNTEYVKINGTRVCCCLSMYETAVFVDKNGSVVQI